MISGDQLDVCGVTGVAVLVFVLYDLAQ